MKLVHSVYTCVQHRLYRINLCTIQVIQVIPLYTTGQGIPMYNTGYTGCPVYDYWVYMVYTGYRVYPGYTGCAHVYNTEYTQGIHLSKYNTTNVQSIVPHYKVYSMQC